MSSAASVAARASRPAVLAGRLVVALLLVLTLAAIAVTFLPGVLGYERYVLVGGSMEPTIQKGSLIFDEIVPVADLRVGDVITYIPPGSRQAVTHRIVSRKTVKGAPVFRTKGDANATRDAKPFKLDHPTQARYSFAIPGLGWAFIALGTPQARFLLLALPALLIALAVLVSLWREGGRLVRARQTTLN